jgi:hypothetical protein
MSESYVSKGAALVKGVNKQKAATNEFSSPIQIRWSSARARAHTHTQASCKIPGWAWSRCPSCKCHSRTCQVATNREWHTEKQRQWMQEALYHQLWVTHFVCWVRADPIYKPHHLRRNTASIAAQPRLAIAILNLVAGLSSLPFD